MILYDEWATGTFLGKILEGTGLLLVDAGYLWGVVKKMLLAILSCLYLLSTSGMQVQHHFCMGHLRATTIGFHENKKCSTCGMESGSSECCHDESQWLKVKDNHAAAIVSSAVPAPFEIVLPPVICYIAAPAITEISIVGVNNLSPPTLSTTDRNVLYCVFRI